MTERYVVPSQLAVADVETFLAAIHEHPERVGSVELDVDRLVASAGSIALMIQAIVTWSRLERGLMMVIKAGETGDRYLDRFVYSDLVLIASLTRCAKIFVQDNQEDIKHALFKASLDRLQAQYGNSIEELISSNSLLLLCADNTSYWQIPHFYGAVSGAPVEIDTLERFQFAAKEIIHSLGEKQFDNKVIIGEKLGGVIQELFKNTDDHARFSVDGSQIGDSMRGLFAARYKLEKQGVGPFDNFCERVLENHPGASVLEVSIFDSGPGMAAAMLGKPITDDESIENEFDLLLRCFNKHATSTREFRRGFGLYRVYKLLTELRGFITIRTGRLYLYRDFRSLGIGTEVRLWDAEQDGLVRKPKAPVVGTVISIFIPITYSVS